MLNDVVRAILAATAVVLMLPSTMEAQKGSLSGTVLSSPNEKPVANAEVIISDLSKTVRTDSLGRFQMDEIPSGSHQILVRHIGYEPYASRLVFKGADKVEADFLLSSVTTLSNVDVRAEIKARYAARLADFDSRRKMGFGKFLTTEYFEKNDVLSLSTILARNFGRLRVSRATGIEVAVVKDCPVQVLLNGMTAYNGDLVLFDLGSIQTTNVIGLEFYDRLNTPMEFLKRPRGNTGGSGCGTLMIWTK